MSTLKDLVNKKKDRRKDTPTKGEFYSKSEDFTFVFKKCNEDLFFYLMDKFPLAFSEQPKISELLKAMNNLIYECVVIDNCKTLKDKEVQEALEIDTKDRKNLIDNSAKALIEDFTERLELGTKILEFSGFGNGSEQVAEIKN
ncbi:hypothetical protein [Clostridium butyricum]